MNFYDTNASHFYEIVNIRIIYPQLCQEHIEQILDVQFTTICLTKQPHSSKIVVILIYYANIHLKRYMYVYITGITGKRYIVRIYYLNVVLNQYLAHIFQGNRTKIYDLKLHFPPHLLDVLRERVCLQHPEY